MLDVDGGVDVDAGAQEFLDILIPLGVAAARRVGVGELVDEDELNSVRVMPLCSTSSGGTCSRPRTRRAVAGRSWGSM